MTDINKENAESTKEALNKDKEVNSIEEEVNNTDETLEDAEKLEDQEFEGISGEEVPSPEEELEEMKLFNSKLKDENKKLQNELETLKERLLRNSAEYENYRKRTSKEKEGIYTDACADVIKEMLPSLDNMERALIVEGSIEDLKKGIEMTIRQFKDGLTKLGVEEISVEEGFDPNFHNAVMHIEDESLGENQIAEVFQKGYKRGDKVLRCSMVKVAN